MKQLIEYIISNIVNHPEDVVVQEEAGEGIVKYLIEVNPEDVGRVIGKQGKVIKAVRQIIRIASIQKGVRAIVDLKEDGKTYAAEESAPETSPVSDEISQAAVPDQEENSSEAE